MNEINPIIEISRSLYNYKKRKIHLFVKKVNSLNELQRKVVQITKEILEIESELYQEKDDDFGNSMFRLNMTTPDGKEHEVINPTLLTSGTLLDRIKLRPKHDKFDQIIPIRRRLDTEDFRIKAQEIHPRKDSKNSNADSEGWFLQGFKPQQIKFEVPVRIENKRERTNYSDEEIRLLLAKKLHLYIGRRVSWEGHKGGNDDDVPLGILKEIKEEKGIPIGVAIGFKTVFLTTTQKISIVDEEYMHIKNIFYNKAYSSKTQQNKYKITEMQRQKMRRQKIRELFGNKVAWKLCPKRKKRIPHYLLKNGAFQKLY
ncbi:hypothetical protein KAJ41_02245 [Candidatus Parcubacteria bacterium]|nr:hypothetical protein [Candidatus Parcubacteria bacterium]